MRNVPNFLFCGNYPNSNGPGPSPKVLKKTLVMITLEGSNKIVNFMTPGAWDLC